MTRTLLALVALFAFTGCKQDSVWLGTWEGATEDCDDADTPVIIRISEASDKEEGVGYADVITSLGLDETKSAIACQGDPSEVDLYEETDQSFIYELLCDSGETVEYVISLGIVDAGTLDGTIAYGSSNCGMGLVKTSGPE